MDENTYNWKEITLGNPQEEGPRRVQQRKSKRKLWLALGALAVAAAVTVILLWDQSSFDGLRRSVIYLTAKKDANGCAELYRYAGDKSSTCAALGGSLVNLSNNQLMLINDKGYTVVNRSIRFTSPALESNGERAVAWDIGGKSLYVLQKKGMAWEITAEGDLIYVSINESNYVTVVSNKSGYKAAVCVYSPKGEPVFQFNSADRFVTVAALSRDNRHLLAVTVGQSDNGFASFGNVYKISSDKRQSEGAICSGMIYDLGWVDGRFCAVAEDGLYFIDNSGQVTATYPYGEYFLRRCELTGNGYAALLLSRYKSGSQNRLVSVNSAGEVLGSCDLDSEILSMSTAGRYTALLCSDHLEICDKTMEQVGLLTEVSDTRQALMRSDGSAVLVGSTAASLYLP